MGYNKKGPFSAVVDLQAIPSFRTRFKSMDNLTDPINMEPMPKADIAEAADAENLREKLGSHQDIRSNPGIILRRWGMKK